MTKRHWTVNFRRFDTKQCS